ncbi:hypothetical protein [Streptomyces sp. NPDC058466]|uniref:hypothetical protein n=1 Tax=Streptomyces sp. NPDC058466 TaxID=3346512 RepID=UPI00365E9E00
MFSENKEGTKFYINGKQFDPDRVDMRAKLNTVEEWTVRKRQRMRNTPSTCTPTTSSS